MSDVKDGGPAFPQSDLSGYGMGPADGQNQGMSLRDWFAGQMMIALPHMGCGCDLEPAEYAADCYRFADAMLAARTPIPTAQQGGE